MTANNLTQQDISPDKRAISSRSNIFICFAADESDFARNLDDALRKRRRVSSINWEKFDASGPDAWSDALPRIETAETFIYIVSPSSIASEDCLRQLESAVNLKKVIVPILRVPVEENKMPDALSAIPAIDLRAEADFLKEFETIIKAVSTNLRIDVFICYSRIDRDFAHRLYEELNRTGRNIWLDLKSIPTSTIWEQEIYSGIEASDNFVFVISPDSTRPESFCHKELARAAEHNKRIIPLYYRDTNPAQIPELLARYQRRDFPVGGNFETDFQQFLADLDQNPDYLREHTRLLTRAIEWQRNGSDASLLLRGKDLSRAEELLRNSAGIQPQFTNLQTQYILESLAAEREELKLAEERRLEAERLRQRAEQQAAISQTRELVLSSEANIKKDVQLSLLLAVEAAEKSLGAEGKIDRRIESILRRTVFGAVPRVPTGTQGIESIAWKPDGQMLAAGSSDGRVAVISAVDMNVVDTFDANGWIDTVDWNDDGTLLAAGTREHLVIIWDNERKEKLGQLDLIEDGVMSVSWRKNSKQIAVALARGPQSVVKVIDWEERQNNQLFEVPGIRGAWSPDGKLLATGGIDGTVRIFKFSGEMLAEMPGHERYVHHISWTSDNTRFATASVDDKVIVWDAVEPKSLKILPAKFALGVAWNPDGSRLVCGSGENLVTVWDGNSYEPVFEYTNITTITGDEIDGTGARGYVLDVDWSPKGDTLAASERGDFMSGAGSVLLFPAGMFQPSIDAEGWLALAKTLRRRSLTDEECKEFLHQEN